MKKTLIALAALAATAAFAQSSVTIYGVVDLGVQSTKATDNNFVGAGVTTLKQTAMSNGVQSGGRLGFRGTEDLGGGLKANFVLEMGITPDEATLTAGANRQAFMSLEGGFGTAAFGRQYTLHHSNQGAGDMVGNITHAGYIGGLDSLVRQSNAITYTSPNMSGFTVAIQKGFGETVTNGANLKQGEQQAIRLTYAAGPLAVGYANETLKNSSFAANLFGTNAATQLFPSTAYTKRNAQNISASYDLGVAKIGWVYNDTSFDNIGGVGVNLDWNANTLTASVPMGAVTLLAGFGSGEFDANGVNFADASSTQLGATYSISKRTNAYAFYGQTKIKAVGAADNVKVNQYTVGLRHSF